MSCCCTTTAVAPTAGDPVPADRLERGRLLAPICTSMYLDQDAVDHFTAELGMEIFHESERNVGKFYTLLGELDQSRLGLPAPCPGGVDVVVVVRGTWSWDDCLVDLQYVPRNLKLKKVHFGFAGYHGGMVELALDMIPQILDAVEEARRRGRQKLGNEEAAGLNNLIVTGHSLGGGIAAIVGHLLHSQEGLWPRTVTYGAPLVYSGRHSEAVQQFCRETMEHFVGTADVVPRLLGSNSSDVLRILTPLIPGRVDNHVAKRVGSYVPYGVFVFVHDDNPEYEPTQATDRATIEQCLLLPLSGPSDYVLDHFMAAYKAGLGMISKKEQAEETEKIRAKNQS